MTRITAVDGVDGFTPEMLRLRVVPPPCQHTWKWVDTHDLWYCPLCRRTESDDDDPDPPAA